jgi:hypothetical protein
VAFSEKVKSKKGKGKRAAPAFFLFHKPPPPSSLFTFYFLPAFPYRSGFIWASTTNE